MNKSAGLENMNFFRRNILKLAAAGLMAVLAAPAFFTASTAAAATSGGEKVLTVYYSRTGNTRALAEAIRSGAGGDILELETVEAYPEDYRATTDQAKKELAENYFPPLKNGEIDIAQYDVIFVGSPSWWGTFAPAIRGFLAQHDFSGKKIVPFITHGGSGLGNSIADLKTLSPGATVLEGLAIRGNRVNSAQGEVTKWLKDHGLGK